MRGDPGAPNLRRTQRDRAPPAGRRVSPPVSPTCDRGWDGTGEEGGLALMDKVRARAKADRGIELEPEVIVLGVDE